MVSQLWPGMTRDQVRLILGTPLLTDIFHANRWDYVYWHEDAAGKREERRIAVHFQDDKLARLDGDVTSAPAAPTPDLPPTQLPPRRDEPK
jgi:outer membrane protein assembly factor BamE